MNEEIEYAEMLEIPVSTVNVVKKRGRKPKKSTALKEQVISKVNDAAKLDERVEETAQAESTPQEELILPTPLPVKDEEPKSLLARYKAFTYSGENGNKRVPAPTERLIFGIEVAAACALCLGIFLTNALLPNSAINTFFRSLTEQQTSADLRTYADFTLTAIAPKGTQLTLSEDGVLSFTGNCCVYPAANGEVVEILHGEDGSYTVKIAHSPAFTAVVSGLDYLPYEEGDAVRHNVPLGYSDGDGEVQVTLFDKGVPLTCFSLSEEGIPVWNESV